MDINSRQAKITKTSILGIIVNLLIAAVKIIIGLAASSFAIVSEGVNNATDAGSSFLTLVGTKLSTKHPDEKHPFGYGRIEYLTGLVVGIMILFAGVSMLREGIDGIIHPADMAVTSVAIIVVALTAVVKFFLGIYTIRIGKQTESDALTAVGEECRNDSFFSIVTIASSVIFLLSGFSLDAYAGAVFAVLVIKTGIETLMSTASDLIGTPGRKELAEKLYREIAATDGIISVADMILHDYGPDFYSGSVNVEIDHKKTVGDVYEVLHALQLRIMYEYHVVMVFGIYAVDQDSPHYKEMRSYITEYVRKNQHIKSFHALYLSEETNTIYVDFVVDYKLEDWEKTSSDFTEYMKKKYADKKLQLTIETEYV